jgi:uncharacterized protein YjbJ (UPF0337 family)
VPYRLAVEAYALHESNLPARPTRPETRETREERIGIRVAKDDLGRGFAKSTVAIGGKMDMNNLSSRTENIAHQVSGKIKEIAGKVMGNKDMEAQGKASQLEGKVRDDATQAAQAPTGKVKEAAHAAEAPTGKVKEAAGEALGKAKEGAEAVKDRATEAIGKKDH